MSTAERVRELLSYDPETGDFRWMVSRGGQRAGSIARCVRHDGYVVIMIDRKLYYAHQLAWLYMHGELVSELDHINGIRSDNRIFNLRPATRTQNNGNSRKPKHNTSGFKGVCYHKRDKKWQAQIHHKGRQIWLGLFDTAEAAHAAYCEKANELFGEFARAA